MTLPTLRLVVLALRLAPLAPALLRPALLVLGALRGQLLLDALLPPPGLDAESQARWLRLQREEFNLT